MSRFVFSCAVLLVITAAALRGFSADESADRGRAEAKAGNDDTYELYRMLADTIDQVERNYVHDVSRRELIEAAIEGVIRKLDPYSSFIKSDEMEEFRRSVDSHFSGIGVRVEVREGQVVVLSPLVGTPAHRAGIHSGDRILRIEGQPVAELPLQEVVKRIQGPPGSEVSLTVLRRGTSQPEELKMAREVIRMETVMATRKKEDDSWDFLYDPKQGIGYLRITVFSRDTAQEVRRALDQLKSQNFRGLVLDMRFNPGGLLSSAIDVADLFLAKGRIVTITGRGTQSREVDAREAGTYEIFPMAVLVNRYSASASEIVAAALQDHQRAVVVGERTWGKGSVQNVIELEGGRSALKLTTSSYLRPNGENIHRFPDASDAEAWGVRPTPGYDIELSDRETSRLLREQRKRDLAALHDTPDSPPEESNTPEPIDSQKNSERTDDGSAPGLAPSQFVDTQLEKALSYLSHELARAK
jgi:carboxyl-terminal processing protease